MRTYSFSRKLAAASLSVVLSLGIAFPPGVAFADPASAEDQWLSASAAAQEEDYSPYSYAIDDPNSEAYGKGQAANDSLPSSYDLRDKGVVTPVKLQNPLGTCWGFAAIAACETSILSEMGTTYEQNALDLSERQLAYFVYNYVRDKDDPQYGEGTHISDSAAAKNKNYLFNLGGSPVRATSLFATGTGPVLEKYAPYRNEEGAIECLVYYPETEELYTRSLTQETIDALEDKDVLVTKLNYASKVQEIDLDTCEVLSEADATWDVDYDSLWGVSSYELEESNILPEFVIKDEEGNYASTSDDAIAATKEEIKEGRAVSVSFAADQSMPGQEVSDAKYINGNWAHYTYEDVPSNHSVTIVGWDDNYAASNFGNVEDPETQPSGNGAWIVKNSWGSATEGSEFPNYKDWGLPDDEGNGTGYFYLSYYDKSICMPESFDFDLSAKDLGEDYLLYAHDYLVAGDDFALSSKQPTAEANVFEAEDNSLIRSLAFETVRPNTEATVTLYLLNDGATSPVDGTAVYQSSATYDYGGYHRITLDKSDWIKAKKGQKFSLVLTQKCTDDGLYYQSAQMAYANTYTEEEKAAEKAIWEAHYKDTYADEYYQMRYEFYVDFAEYSEEEAAAAAANDRDEYIETEEFKERVAEAVDEEMALLGAVSYETHVNAGESYTLTYASEDDADGTWSDWSGIVAKMEAESAELGDKAVYDNFPLKVYAEIDSSEPEDPSDPQDPEQPADPSGEPTDNPSGEQAADGAKQSTAKTGDAVPPFVIGSLVLCAVGSVYAARRARARK